VYNLLLLDTAAVPILGNDTKSPGLTTWQHCAWLQPASHLHNSMLPYHCCTTVVTMRAHKQPTPVNPRQDELKFPPRHSTHTCKKHVALQSLKIVTFRAVVMLLVHLVCLLANQHIPIGIALH
jgi:hypothetical protein